MPDAATVLEAVRAEDLDARFEAFVVSHRQRAMRLAWRLLGARDAEAEDVVQDAFVRAHRALGRFRGEASLETWFYRILIRQASNRRRWCALRERWSGASAHEELADPAGGRRGDPLLRRRIGAALDGLSRAQREAFVLVHLEGHTVQEAAALLGKPVGTLKSHLHRALGGLRRQLGDLSEAGKEEST